MLLQNKQKLNKKRLGSVKRFLALYLKEVNNFNDYRMTKDEIKCIETISGQVTNLKLIASMEKMEKRL